MNSKNAINHLVIWDHYQILFIAKPQSSQKGLNLAQSYSQNSELCTRFKEKFSKLKKCSELIGLSKTWSRMTCMSSGLVSLNFATLCFAQNGQWNLTFHYKIGALPFSSKVHPRLWKKNAMCFYRYLSQETSFHQLLDFWSSTCWIFKHAFLKMLF